MIQQKLVLDTDQLFLASPVWYDRASLHRKMLRDEREFFHEFRLSIIYIL